MLVVVCFCSLHGCSLALMTCWLVKAVQHAGMESATTRLAPPHMSSVIYTHSVQYTVHVFVHKYGYIQYVHTYVCTYAHTVHMYVQYMVNTSVLCILYTSYVDIRTCTCTYCMNPYVQ